MSVHRVVQTAEHYVESYSQTLAPLGGHLENLAQPPLVYHQQLEVKEGESGH